MKIATKYSSLCTTWLSSTSSVSFSSVSLEMDVLSEGNMEKNLPCKNKAFCGGTGNSSKIIVFVKVKVATAKKDRSAEEADQ